MRSRSSGSAKLAWVRDTAGVVGMRAVSVPAKHSYHPALDSVSGTPLVQAEFYPQFFEFKRSI